MDNEALILSCNADGIITKIIRDSYNELEIKEKTPLIKYFSEDEHSKFMEAFNQTLTQGSFIGDSLKFINNQEIFVSFLKQEATIIFLGFLKDNESVDLLEEIIKINNTQTNMIRKLYKKIALNKNEIENFNEMMKLNNQLINVQRDLSKKNHMLEILMNIKNY